MKALLIALEKLWLNTKLVMAFMSGLLVAVAIGLYSLDSMTDIESKIELIYEKELLGISHIKEANINLVYMGRALNRMLLAPDDEARDRARAQLEAARQTLRSELAEGRKRIFREEAIARHEQFQRNFARFDENVQHAMSMLEREKLNSSTAAKFISSSEFLAALNAADEDLDALTKIKARGSSEIVQLIRQEASGARRFAALLLGAGIILAVVFGVFIGNSIRRPNDRLRAAVEGLAAGDVAAPIPHADYPNEIGIMARAIKVLQGIYRKAEDTRWIKSHAAEIGAELQRAEDPRGLAQLAVSRIATVLKAGHGALYVVDGDGRLAMRAGYGHRERKHLNNSFAIGEGLVGQCAMEKTSITLTAPKDYIRINSGLGEAVPACVAVLPILRNDSVLGVMEIASFQQFEERETQLLDALMPVLAATMEIMDRNERTRELLVSTQQQAERMEKQAAQLEEQAVEMEAQQLELRETESWYRGIIESTADGMLIVEESGSIAMANPAAERLFGYGAGEMTGMNVDELVPQRIRAVHPQYRSRFMAERESRTMGDRGGMAGAHRDGSEFAIVLSLSMLPARGGRGQSVCAVVRPVTHNV